MQRAVASLLIALVGLMAWLPQALCPCAQRARAEQAQAVAAGVAAPQACCPMCAAREAALAHRFAGAAVAGGHAAPGRPGDGPASRETPPTCPCCEINGGGKYLLQLGGTVRPEPTVPVVLFAFPPLFAALDLYQPARVCVRALDDLPDDAAPAQRRAGVVLLI